MRRPGYSWLILTILSFLILQVSILPLVEVRGIRPDLLLIAIVFFSLRLGPTRGLVLGLITGFLKDCLGNGLFGGYAFCFALLGLIVGYNGKVLYRESPYTQVVVTFLASCLAYFLYYLLVKLYQAMPPMTDSFRWVILPASIYTAVVCLPVFFLLQKIWDRHHF